jgi:hypothetical protein
VSNPIISLQHSLSTDSAVLKSIQANSHEYKTKGNGYFVQQATHPQTLGYGLADSPVGLLAWIYEKLYFWTDRYPWTEDEILTWISVYWFSKAGPTSSTRIYYEYVQTQGGLAGEKANTNIPLGLSYFPGEIGASPPRSVSSRT